MANIEDKTYSLPQIIDLLNGLPRFVYTYDGLEEDETGEVMMTADIAKVFGLSLDVSLEWKKEIRKHVGAGFTIKQDV